MLLKIGDTVQLFNGVTGVVKKFELTTYRTTYRIELDARYNSGWYHIINIKSINGIDVNYTDIQLGWQESIRLYDFLGEPLYINDTVVFCQSGYRNFLKGRIIKITEKKVFIESLTSVPSGSKNIKQSPSQVIKIKP